MNVKELKELLGDIDDDFEIIVSSDGEGNEFKALDDISFEHVENSEDYFIELIDDKNGEKVLVLWPN